MDLKFPSKPIVSSAAKDLISQVFVFLLCLARIQITDFTHRIQEKVPLILYSLLFLKLQMLVKETSQSLPLHKLLEHPWIIQNADPTGVYKV